jgi:hypothetical protein
MPNPWHTHQFREHGDFHGSFAAQRVATDKPDFPDRAPTSLSLITVYRNQRLKRQSG